MDKNEKEIFIDLEKRVRQFQTMELPGQPQFFHMGTARLISDLWDAIKKLRVELEAEKKQTKNLEIQLLSDVTLSDWAIEHLKEIDRLREEVKAEKEKLKIETARSKAKTQTIKNYRHENLLLREALEQLRKVIIVLNDQTLETFRNQANNESIYGWDKARWQSISVAAKNADRVLNTLPDRAAKLRELVEAAEKQAELGVQVGGSSTTYLIACAKTDLAARAYKEVEGWKK